MPREEFKPIDYSDLDGQQIKGPNPMDLIQQKTEYRMTMEGLEEIAIDFIPGGFPTDDERSKLIGGSLEGFYNDVLREGNK